MKCACTCNCEISTIKCANTIQAFAESLQQEFDNIWKLPSYTKMYIVYGLVWSLSYLIWKLLKTFLQNPVSPSGSSQLAVHGCVAVSRPWCMWLGASVSRGVWLAGCISVWLAGCIS